MRGTKSTLLEFYARIGIGSPYACWLWTGAITPWGYGKSPHPIFGTDRAHRIAYILTKGDLTPGMHVDHLCRNRSCTNPMHLEEVTSNENAFRRRKLFCKNGHEQAVDGWRKGHMMHCRGCKRLYYRQGKQK